MSAGIALAHVAELELENVYGAQNRRWGSPVHRQTSSDLLRWKIPVGYSRKFRDNPPTCIRVKCQQSGNASGEIDCVPVFVSAT